MRKINLFFIIFLFLVSGCASQDIKELQEVEISEYEGERLGSIADFRENSIKGPQYIDIDDYNLKVTGLVENPVDYTYEEVLEKERYKKVVKIDCVEGWSVNILWEGVLARELIEKAKPLPETNTIIFYAYDGYSTSFPIEYIMGNDIIMAYKMNGVVIPPERGFPFQLVAESKWGYKWIKWITKIELSDNEDYEGYWESRGYSNAGDLDKGFFK
ncbi:molybdopterin-dependent oxidoreductase [Candidatus Woesearchaeota archaeon]|nr:molybdopterin-dependent oxidoreductase [Candidatus Woesearchaeota archaeon]